MQCFLMFLLAGGYGKFYITCMIILAMLEILVIDDDPLIRVSIFDYLVAKAHNVEVASNGVQAVAMVKKKSYDLIFTDYNMPGMNGDEVFRKIRAINPKVPVFLVSAKYFSNEQIQVIGFTGYVQKGVYVIHAIDEIVQKYIS